MGTCHHHSASGSCVLAWLLLTAAAAMFVMEPRKATGVATLFCLVVGAF
jgi:hypothetical protein